VGGSADGGGIYNAGTLSVVGASRVLTNTANAAVSNNTAFPGLQNPVPGGAAAGGGIYNITGTLTVSGATVAANTVFGGTGGLASNDISSPICRWRRRRRRYLEQRRRG